MEAIAHGAVFLNPAFSGAQRNVLRENGKPTARQVSGRDGVVKRSQLSQTKRPRSFLRWLDVGRPRWDSFVDFIFC